MSDDWRPPGEVRIQRRGARVDLTIERPPLNVLDLSLNGAIAFAVTASAADPDVGVLVLDGGSARGFSAGVEVGDHVEGKVEDMLERFHAAIRALWDAPCPTVAAVHGFALGGGLELALACDLVIVEADARLGFPEIGLGCYPPAAAAMLPARVGWAAACELVLTGEPFTPERALALGLINRIAAPGTLAAETERLVAPMLTRSPAVLREAKQALGIGASAPATDALGMIERHYFHELMVLDDAREGIAAFQEKRPPRWKNR